jgi:hypothetical protein
MPVAVCPHCRARINYRDGQAGAVVNCPACQGSLTLPAPPAAPATREPEGWQELAAVDERESDEGGREPWFYSFLATYAKVLLGLGIVAGTLGAAGVFWLVGLAFWFLGLLFLVALILLLVDVGRNLRQVRRNTAR